MALRILVADDASFIRDLVKKHLREHFPGVEIYEATDGSRALAALRGQTMDLVLSDWEMPNVSGEELLRTLRGDDRYRDVPFIMISSRGGRDHVVKAVQAGVSDYLTKPFTPEELIRKVMRQLQKAGIDPGDKRRRGGSSQAVGSGSVEVLTGGGGADDSSASRPVSSKTGDKGRAQLRFSSKAAPVGSVLKELSLQALTALFPRPEALPGLFDQVAVHILREEGEEPLQLNGYVHSLQAGESRPDTKIIKTVVRFVDNDDAKFEQLSRLIGGSL